LTVLTSCVVSEYVKGLKQWRHLYLPLLPEKHSPRGVVSSGREINALSSSVVESDNFCAVFNLDKTDNVRIT
jgi:hypothetical protein